MEHRRFGRTELRVPVFTCGGMRYQQSWSSGTPVKADNQRNLEATIDRSLALGINHIETARGYGTSEAQLGVALARHPRATFLLQTKVAPTRDPRVFARHLEESFARLRVDRLDLFAFHGINRPEHLEWTLRPGGCLEVAEGFRRAGRIRAIGFSTHAPCSLIEQTIASDKFDYVNLHYYYIFQDNRPAIEAARRHDLGVFIISPSDKGGRLYQPTRELVELCAPLSPMVFNDLFCLTTPGVHTLSLGAARPSDFDEHMKVPALLPGAVALVSPVVERLDRAYRDAVGADFAARWQEGIPEWDALPGGVNVKMILWMLNLVRAFGLVDWARQRYGWMTGDDPWVPGAQAGDLDEAALRRALAASPFRDRIPDLLREAHALLAARR